MVPPPDHERRRRSLAVGIANRRESHTINANRFRAPSRVLASDTLIRRAIFALMPNIRVDSRWIRSTPLTFLNREPPRGMALAAGNANHRELHAINANPNARIALFRRVRVDSCWIRSTRLLDWVNALAHSQSRNLWRQDRPRSRSCGSRCPAADSRGHRHANEEDVPDQHFQIRRVDHRHAMHQ